MSFAFFDLDQTLIPYDTQALFCQFILKRHPLRRAYLAAFLPALPLAPLRIIGETGLKRLFLNYLCGMTKSQLEIHVGTFVNEVIAPLLYPSVVAELKQHQAAGLTTILNTASPDFYAQEIARHLEFDHCFATKIDLGTSDIVPFTPRIIGGNNKGPAKLRAMAHLLPTPRPIPGSIAYSDSHADLPMLLMAENAVMVHPTAKLSAAGSERGWKTLTPPRPFRSKFQHHCNLLRQVVGI